MSLLKAVFEEHTQTDEYGREYEAVSQHHSERALYEKFIDPMRQTIGKHLNWKNYVLVTETYAKHLVSSKALRQGWNLQRSVGWHE